MTTRIEFRKVAKRFGALLAVENVGLAVRDGEIVSLIGPSGCGKSTLLNMGSGLFDHSLNSDWDSGVRPGGPR